MTAIPRRITDRLDEIEAGPAVIAIGLTVVATVAAAIWGWRATPFITVAALVYAQLAWRDSRASKALMVANLNGIHQAGMDAHRALGAVKGLQAAALGIEEPSTGKHGGKA